MCFFKMRAKTKNEGDLGFETREIQHKKEALGMFSKVEKGQPRKQLCIRPSDEPCPTGAGGLRLQEGGLSGRRSRNQSVGSSNALRDLFCQRVGGKLTMN